VTWVIAHRGASADEVENTLPAFERAIADGADFLELDVQASADGALVVFHDLDLDRLTPLRGPLRARGRRELREVGIPTLEEVVELARGRVGLMVELKSPHLYRRHDLPARTVRLLSADDVVLSFERRALLAARAAAPRLRLLQHVGYGVSIRAAAGYAWAIGLHDPRVTRRALARAAAAGLRTTVYTVNDAPRMRELATLGVDGIFSDRPRLLAEVVRERRASPL
jgi:glycerophosphoryl diester phosphodiesterase